jgi:hypothetical protein
MPACPVTARAQDPPLITIKRLLPQQKNKIKIYNRGNCRPKITSPITKWSGVNKENPDHRLHQQTQSQPHVAGEIYWTVSVPYSDQSVTPQPAHHIRYGTLCRPLKI